MFSRDAKSPMNTRKPQSSRNPKDIGKERQKRIREEISRIAKQIAVGERLRKERINKRGNIGLKSLKPKVSTKSRTTAVRKGEQPKKREDSLSILCKKLLSEANSDEELINLIMNEKLNNKFLSTLKQNIEELNILFEKIEWDDILYNYLEIIINDFYLNGNKFVEEDLNWNYNKVSFDKVKEEYINKFNYNIIKQTKLNDPRLFMKINYIYLLAYRFIDNQIDNGFLMNSLSNIRYNYRDNYYNYIFSELKKIKFNDRAIYVEGKYENISGEINFKYFLNSILYKTKQDNKDELSDNINNNYYEYLKLGISDIIKLDLQNIEFYENLINNKDILIEKILAITETIYYIIINKIKDELKNKNICKNYKQIYIILNLIFDTNTKDLVCTDEYVSNKIRDNNEFIKLSQKIEIYKNTTSRDKRDDYYQTDFDFIIENNKKFNKKIISNLKEVIIFLVKLLYIRTYILNDDDFEKNLYEEPII